MNKLTPRVEADDEIGPLDEHGQQIWSAEDEAAIARMEADPEFQAGLRRAEADIATGRVYTHEEVVARSAERRRRWRVERGL